MDNQKKEAVDHPQHYNGHPSGIECITVVEHMGFNLGNAIKYIWRADLKADAIEDLRKAAWYVNREIGRRTGAEPDAEQAKARDARDMAVAKEVVRQCRACVRKGYSSGEDLERDFDELHLTAIIAGMDAAA